MIVCQVKRHVTVIMENVVEIRAHTNMKMENVSILMELAIQFMNNTEETL